MNKENRTMNEMLFNKEKKRILGALRKASENNPYYKKLFEKSGVSLEDSLTYDEFLRIPVLTKTEYREKQAEIDQVLEGKKTIAHSTSGSTGRPIRITRLLSDEARMNFLLNRYRIKRVPNIVVKTGVAFHFIHHKKVFDCQEDGYYIMKYEENFWGFQYLFFNDVTYKASMEFLNKEKPAWACGSPSFWYNFSKYVLEHGGLTHQLEYIECNSEYLDEEMSKVIKEAFGIAPVSMYGANELNAIAIQCKCGEMHIMNDCVFCEIEPETNELIITSLCNFTNPFIRFRIGDIGSWAETCQEGCELTGPVIKLAGYRSNDYCIIAKNQRVDMWFFTGMIRRLRENKGVYIKQQRIVQYKDGLLFEIVTDSAPEGYQETVTNTIQDEMNKLFNRPVKIDVDFKDEILPDPVSGKFKYFASKMEEKHFTEE